MAALASAGPQWWLLQDGSPAGPYPESEIVRLLEEGQLSTDILACPVGSTDWQPIRNWNALFSGQLGSPDSDRMQAPCESASFLRRPVVHSPVQPLPDMARWICAYGLFVHPTLWLFSKLSCLAGPPIFVDDSPLFDWEVIVGLVDLMISATAAVLLFLGAMQLTNRKRISLALLSSGLGVSLGWLIVSLLWAALVFAAAASEPGVQHFRASEESSPGLAILQCALGFAATVFEIVGLVWLLTTGRRLQLTS
ncbi:MAG: DUF4339 domain-containing protein [Planctomycetaceae bacterium]|nr:DUF4339 domain-containing protein [Planctomycetaceae bacterium]